MEQFMGGMSEDLAVAEGEEADVTSERINRKSGPPCHKTPDLTRSYPRYAMPRGRSSATDAKITPRHRNHSTAEGGVSAKV